MAAEQFDTIFEECLTAIAAGKATAAECVARYPGQPELAELLELAMVVQQAPLPEPDPVWFAASKARIMAAPLPRQSTQLFMQVLPLPFVSWPGNWFNQALSNLLRPVVAQPLGIQVASMATAMTLGYGALSGASANVTPDNPLHVVRQVNEQAQLVTAFTPDARAGLHYSYALARLDMLDQQPELTMEPVSAKVVREAQAELRAAAAVLPAQSPEPPQAAAIRGREIEFTATTDGVAVVSGSGPLEVDGVQVQITPATVVEGSTGVPGVATVRVVVQPDGQLVATSIKTKPVQAKPVAKNNGKDGADETPAAAVRARNEVRPAVAPVAQATAVARPDSTERTDRTGADDDERSAGAGHANGNGNANGNRNGNGNASRRQEAPAVANDDKNKKNDKHDEGDDDRPASPVATPAPVATADRSSRGSETAPVTKPDGKSDGNADAKPSTPVEMWHGGGNDQPDKKAATPAPTAAPAKNSGNGQSQQRDDEDKPAAKANTGGQGGGNNGNGQAAKSGGSNGNGNGNGKAEPKPNPPAQDDTRAQEPAPAPAPKATAQPAEDKRPAPKADPTAAPTPDNDKRDTGKPEAKPAEKDNGKQPEAKADSGNNGNGNGNGNSSAKGGKKKD